MGLVGVNTRGMAMAVSFRAIAELAGRNGIALLLVEDFVGDESFYYISGGDILIDAPAREPQRARNLAEQVEEGSGLRRGRSDRYPDSEQVETPLLADRIPDRLPAVAVVVDRFVDPYQRRR